jgi:phage/plasmid-like protein (TIGR03299 family)
MSAEISVQDGIAEAMFAGKPAWHGLGQVVDDAPTAEAAIRLAHLDWTVGLWTLSAAGMNAARQPQKSSVGEFRATVRIDTGEVLGIVGRQYRPVQNSEAFAFADSLVSDGAARYESAGALRGGRLVWMLARLGDPFDVVPGDPTMPYLLMHNGHDGRRAVRVGLTAVRVVCANTLNLALRGMSGTGMVIRHCGRLEDQLDQARAVLGLSTAAVAEYADAARRMAARPATSADAREFFATLLPPNAEEDAKAEQAGRPNMRRANVRARMAQIFEADPTQQMPGVRGTRWAAFNAVTQWVDHEMPVRARVEADRPASRMESVLFGSGASLKARAFALAVA